MTIPTQAQIEAAAKGVPRATAYAEQIIENSARFSDEVVNLAEQYLHFRDASAAQVGEQYRQEANAAIDTGIRIATIERCAQVAEQILGSADDDLGVATAIRKLKEPQPPDPNLIHPGKDPDFVFPEE